MAESRQATLIQLLHDRTLENKIQWERTARTGTFQSAFSNYGLSISRFDSPNMVGSYDIVINILDENGEVVEEIWDEEVRFEDLEKNAYNLMKETYARAQRFANGADRAIDVILNELK